MVESTLGTNHKRDQSRCQRCGGAFTRDQDGDAMCLMCGRPAMARRWEPANREEAHREQPRAA